ncbi:hypothetical protein ES288_A01G109700v1 [Gossypium darwinii]|uniref:Ataxin-10 domain-containing protein n=1 Tax=Gossypium darwinii TaxID=34276 RepID=A0A5D2HMK2_GOSDA|nr:hypothetical protein ES288_A01G109700v1 [Gossypium darwinii]
MVGESLPELNYPNDVLQPLLSASNSSSLQQALEILIKDSRAAVGRGELASKNILPTVLKLVESLHRASSREYLMQAMKLLRNLCAGEVANQNSLQVLANVSLAGAEHQHDIWLKMFPNEFFILASIRSQKTSDPLCMILYTCCDGRPALDMELCRDPGLPIVAGIIPTIASVGSREDWFKLLLSRLCLKDIHFPALFFKLCEGNASEDRGNTALGDNTALCVLGIFKRSVSIVDFGARAKSGLPTGSTSVDVMGYSLIFLRDICAQDGLGDLKKDSVDVVDLLLSNDLTDVILSLLYDLEPPAIIRKTLKDGETLDLNLGSTKLCPYKGFRRDLVVIIGNCAYRRKNVQDEIRQKSNAENQQIVADLQLQGSVDMPELARLGLKVEVDQNTHRAKLVNIPGSYTKPFMEKMSIREPQLYIQAHHTATFTNSKC